MNKIHVFYRHYNVSGTDTRRPDWFTYEKCFENLINTCNDNVVIHIIYDTHKSGDNWILKYANDYDIHYFDGGHDWLSFQETGRYIEKCNLDSSDLIYLLENDYLHQKNWVDEIFTLYKTYSGLNYVSLYDHNDKYFLPQYESLTSKIITTETLHWRTTPSTCGTFIISKEIYDLDKDILFEMFGDHNKFIWLNENRGRFVLTPIPGLSTHCVSGLLSPTINWELINKM